jgi:6-phosphogluconate dehydrogenase-like protein
MATVGFLGLGNGAPMAAGLIEAGHPVTVWNRTRSRVAIADSPADAACDVDAVTTMVATPAALSEVLFGGHGVSAGIQACITLGYPASPLGSPAGLRLHPRRACPERGEHRGYGHYRPSDGLFASLFSSPVGRWAILLAPTRRPRLPSPPRSPSGLVTAARPWTSRSATTWSSSYARSSSRRGSGGPGRWRCRDPRC